MQCAGCLTVVGPQIFGDLPLAVSPAFLVQRDPDPSVRGDHDLGAQGRVFTGDIELPEFAEAEYAGIEVLPVGDTAIVEIVREVVDAGESRAFRLAIHAFQIVEIDVVYRKVVIVAVDQVDQRASDPADCGQPQFHRSCRHVDRLRPAPDCLFIGFLCVPYTKTHAARRWPVFRGKIGGGTSRLVVGDEIDPALSIEVDILGSVTGDVGEAHDRERPLQHAFFRRAEFEEFESVQGERIFEIGWFFVHSSYIWNQYLGQAQGCGPRAGRGSFWHPRAKVLETLGQL